MKAGALLAAAAALGAAFPAGAQEGADRARLDDFALPQDERGARVEQLGTAESAVPGADRGTSDRELGVPGPPASARAPVAQLSQTGETAGAQQLSDPVQSRQLAAGSVSSTGDSRPQSSAPLSGSDRCDPQLEAAELEQCLRILERRAAEFDAPEAPRLSAEQALLAERGDDSGMLASSSSDLRVRLAADDPDADLASNQELASILTDRSRSPNREEGTLEPEQPDEDTLAQVLEGLQIDVTGPAGQ